jgi:hypothetical protein
MRTSTPRRFSRRRCACAPICMPTAGIAQRRQSEPAALRGGAGAYLDLLPLRTNPNAFSVPELAGKIFLAPARANTSKT